ncbi:MAG: PIG-L family deacetylase [Acidobacteriota bacterium]
MECHLLTATRGERGRYGAQIEFPGLSAVGKLREAELLAAARELGLKQVFFLDYIDGELDRAEPKEVIARIVRQLRQVRPHVVLTFGPEGAYGHTDHIAICQFTTAAVVSAADPAYRLPESAGPPPPSYRVSKLYYIAWTREKWEAYQAAFRDLKSKVDGIERRAVPWPDWAITTHIDTRAHWQTVWRAVCCHQTQLAIYDQLEHLSPEHHQAVWGSQEYYRVFSLVNGGRTRETDLFEGLRISS